MIPLLLALLAQQPHIITGRVLALYPPSADRQLLRVVVRTSAGVPYRLWVWRLTGTGTQMVGGDTVTVWWHAAGVDTVADSVRVEGGP